MESHAQLKPKDTAQLATWISDETDPKVIETWKTKTAPAIFKEGADEVGVILGPITFYELKPGEQNAGTPGDEVQGTNVRLLVAHCEVVAVKQDLNDNLWLADLDSADLKLLRRITRCAARPHRLTDEQCDEIIARHGPVVAQKLIKATVDARIIH